jgi:hypothetical protein
LVVPVKTSLPTLDGEGISYWGSNK